MLEKYIGRPYQHAVVMPLTGKLCQWRWHPNWITVLAAMTGMGIPYALWQGHVYSAVVLLIISGYLDTLDGVLARAQQCQSALGATLDITCDRLVEFAIIFGLLLVSPATRAVPITLMLGSILICVTTFLIVGMFTENDTAKSFFYDVGLIERAEAFIFFALMIVFPVYFNWLAYLFSALVFLTAVLRLLSFVQTHRQ